MLIRFIAIVHGLEQHEQGGYQALTATCVHYQVACFYSKASRPTANNAAPCSQHLSHFVDVIHQFE